MNDKAPLLDAVIDVLATWGAAERPGARELLQLLDEMSGQEQPDLLGQVLEATGSWLDPALREELSRIRDTSRAIGEPDLPSRTRRALSDSLASRVAERRASLEDGLSRAVLGMEGPEREAALGLLWGSDAAGDIDTKLSALRSLDRLEQRLGDARDRRVREVLALLETGGDAAGEELCRSAAAAIDSGDLVSLDAVRRDLQHRQEDTGREQRERQVGAARRRLSTLCDECRQLGHDAESVADARTTELLTKAIGTAERALAEEGHATDAAYLERLELTERTLLAMREGLSGPVEAARKKRESVARSVLRRSAGRAELEGSTEAELSRVARRGGLVFHSRLEQMLGQTDADATDAVPDKEVGRLRRTVEGTARLLEESAALLPTEHVLTLRRLIDRAEPFLAGRRAERMSDLRAEIERDSREARRLIDRAGKLRRDRGAVARQRLTARAERAAGVAERAEAVRLAALSRELDGASGSKLADLERQIVGLARPIENRVRLDAARRLAAAGGDERAQALEAALDADDLAKIAEISSKLQESSGGPTFSQEPEDVSSSALLASYCSPELSRSGTGRPADPRPT